MAERNLLDILWILVCSGLVILMQAGFLVLESGLTRAKNSINVAIKNIADFSVATILFYSFGFGLMFGETWHGVIGTADFFPLFAGDNGWLPAFFLFELAFCGTASTIVSGAVAERLKFGSYIFVTIVISGFLYPIIGHWIWGNTLHALNMGWLAKLGFRDFAGATLVHSLGGWVSLALLIVVGPRLGRFPENEPPKKVTSSNLPMAMLGGIILWFGWLGFNGGSTLAFNDKVPMVILNTVVSCGFALFTSLGYSWLKKGYPDPISPLNGSLAGLVAITASAHSVSVHEAIWIGSIAGLFVNPVERLLERFKIDDAVGAISVHLAGGIWGTIALGIFGDLQTLGVDMDRISFLLVQLGGIFVVGAFSFLVSYFIFKVFHTIFPMRVDVEEERMGLNISEHRATTEFIDLFLAMDYQRKTGDLGLNVPVEPFTEVGQIAERYNLVLDKVRNTLKENEEARQELANAYEKVRIEQERAEKLLLNVLPKSIADQLKGKQGLIANSYPNVTVLFADIVGFTKLSSGLKPEAVVRILNEIFSYFDVLAEKYKLEKIKTIGDAYMAVAGLPNPLPDHPLLVAHMAWDMRGLLSRLRLSKAGTKLTMRIGINTGHVVAGVIGTKKFIYDIWGDAVNLASRMESQGLPGEIQITEDTAKYLKKDFLLEERGQVEIKGKGLIKTFLLKERLIAPENSIPFIQFS